MGDYRLDLDGAGLYNREYIKDIGEEHYESETETKSHAPQIEEVRAIRGYDGETYVNVKDLEIAMLMVAFRTFPTLSILKFINTMNHNLQGGDHAR